MSNREEFNKILQVIGTDEYPEDKEFIDGCFKGFRLLRILLYISIFGMWFVMMHGNRLFHMNEQLRPLFVFVTLIILYVYIFRKKKITQELVRYLSNECRPDIGVARYLGAVSRLMKSEILWSNVQYNFGCALYRLGKIDQSAKCLALMQESCNTATEILLAEHLKSLIALYYKDYDTVITCANDVAVLYPKLKNTENIRKIYNDIQRSASYAQCCKTGDFRQIYSVLQAPNAQPVDEVSRFYYLYCAAKELEDIENAKKYREYVRQNAGTTWYGRAVEDGFIPEAKSDSYPGFIADPEKLSKPRAVNMTRVKYLGMSVVVVLLLYFVPILIIGN